MDAVQVSYEKITVHSYCFFAGSITIGFAKYVGKDGKVIGIDIEKSQIDAANDLLNKQENSEELTSIVSFVVGDVYQLPFENQFFDAVFGNACMYHLADKEKAINELKRVLKPGGLIAIRDAYDTATILQPELPDHQAMLNVMTKLSKLKSGSDTDFGVKQAPFLREHGFKIVHRSASFENVNLSLLKSEDFTAKVLRDEKFQKAAMQLGFVENVEMFARFEVAAKEWSEHPDAMIARCRMECVAQLL